MTKVGVDFLWLLAGCSSSSGVREGEWPPTDGAQDHM